MRVTKVRASLMAVAAASAVSRPFSRSSRRRLARPQPALRRWRAAPQGRGRGPAPVPDVPPMKVYIYGGPKTHGEGQHDYPQFIADWSKILQNRGANVDGGLHFPTRTRALRRRRPRDLQG